MEKLITKELLAKVESEFVEKKSLASLNEAVELSAKRGSISTEVTVFLSHKHSDKALVRQAISLFRTVGVSVYVDWMDTSMPPVTSPSTADRLKRKIRQSNKFVLLASDDAIDSKWCNWELGLGDAAKYLEHIAILPAGSRDKEWKGSEYLGIYPVITSKYTYVTGTYYVEFGDKKTPLEEWLRA